MKQTKYWFKYNFYNLRPGNEAGPIVRDVNETRAFETETIKNLSQDVSRPRPFSRL